MAGRDHAYVLVRDWLGTPPGPIERDRALAELAVRYLAGHGPATDRDLAQWAGLPLGDARRGLAAAGSRITGTGDGLTALARPPGGLPEPGLPPEPGRLARPGQFPEQDRPGEGDQPGIPPPLLLGAYDPLLLGWSSREPIVGPHGPKITINGLFRPFALAGGRAVATWSMPGGRVEVAPFAPLPEPVTAALTADAAKVEHFLASRPG
jgi:hypothetical protein